MMSEHIFPLPVAGIAGYKTIVEAGLGCVYQAAIESYSINTNTLTGINNSYSTDGLRLISLQYTLTTTIVRSYIYLPGYGFRRLQSIDGSLAHVAIGNIATKNGSMAYTRMQSNNYVILYFYNNETNTYNSVTITQFGGASYRAQCVFSDTDPNLVYILALVDTTSTLFSYNISTGVLSTVKSGIIDVPATTFTLSSQGSFLMHKGGYFYVSNNNSSDPRIYKFDATFTLIATLPVTLSVGALNLSIFNYPMDDTKLLVSPGSGAFALLNLTTFTILTKISALSFWYSDDKSSELFIMTNSNMLSELSTPIYQLDPKTLAAIKSLPRKFNDDLGNGSTLGGVFTDSRYIFDVRYNAPSGNSGSSEIRVFGITYKEKLIKK